MPGARVIAACADAALLALPVAYAVVLCIQFRHGFDFTDEGYYLVNYVHWRNTPASLTFFGAYLGPAYAWLGESIYAMRILGLALLIGSSLFFSVQFVTSAYFDGVPRRWRTIVAGILVAVAMAYYAPWSTLFTPGYNLLSFVLILLSTGLVLRFGRASRPWLALAIYGLGLGALLFVKFPAFFACLGAHCLMLFLLVSPDRRLALIVGMLASSLLGSLVSFAFFLIAGADMSGILRTGFEYLQLLQPRDLPLEGLRAMFVEVPKMLLASAASTWPVLPIALAGRRYGAQSSAWFTVAIVAILATAFAPWSFGAAHGSRNSAVWFAIGGLMVLWRRYPFPVPTVPARDDRPLSGLLLLALMPAALVVGTSNELRHAAAMAIVFPVAVCLTLVVSAYMDGKLPAFAVRACLLIVGLAPIPLIGAPWIDARSTYRIGTALREQRIPIEAGGGAIAVDPNTAEALRDYRAALARLGFRAGMPMLDMTGAGPGLIYLAGGQPVGRAWILGGYPRSTEAAAYLLTQTDDRLLRNAWILASPDHYRRLDFATLLQARLGSAPLYRNGASFRLPFANFESTPGRPSATIQIWVPCGSRGSLGNCE